jgi:hypothetical protein
MAKGGAIAAAAAKMGTESKPKKKRIRVVSKDVTRDDVTDERTGYKNVTRQRLHGGTVTTKKKYEGDVTKTEKVKTDRSGKVKKVVLKKRKQVDAYKNKKGTASRLSQDNNAKRTGAIKPKERTSRRVLKGDAAEKYVDDKKKAAAKAAAKAAVSERVKAKADYYRKGVKATKLTGEPIRPTNPYK